MFFWLKSIDLAKESVKARVLEGGHNIDTKTIERRYIRGITNLFDIYLPIFDETMIFDNSEGRPIVIVEKFENGEINISNKRKFTKLKRIYESS
ncbi:MAG: hypothetical protein RQ735_02430 [Flavobacteriaceae bacterium]|nr:hypothetical protein [Flavobacteriaceae bacterium]